MMENGYAICFNEWALDKDIKTELGLLCIISSLCAEKGYCYANNDYFANLFDIDKVSVSRRLKNLENKNYITITYNKSGNVVISREIRLTKMLTAVNKNVKENNININIKEIDNNKLLSTKKSKNFTAPTIEEIENYCKEKNYSIDIKKFFDYYNDANWIDSKGQKVKNWKQRVVTWASRTNNTNQSNGITPSWFKQEIKDEEISEEEKKELKKLMSEIDELNKYDWINENIN